MLLILVILISLANPIDIDTECHCTDAEVMSNVYEEDNDE